MGHWHVPHEGVCLVCLAGCTIARHSGKTSIEDMVPGSFDSVTNNKLRALDRLGSNMIGDGVNMFYEHDQIKTNNVMRATFNDLDFRLPDHYHYDSDRLKFLKNMRWLVRKFKAAGY